MTGRGGGGAGDPVRPFDCLWCGTTWQPGSAQDLEAEARLCPDCLGRAGDNAFLRFRLRAALDGRARARQEDPDPVDLDDWYLRRGRHAHGPVHDVAWQMELDAATTWLDGLPLGGVIVELGAGTGWWSGLLATKGELHAHDASGRMLDRARERLLAHRLMAHLHVRVPWAPPDRAVDAVVVSLALGGSGEVDRRAALGVVRRWLKPGGRAAFVSAVGDPVAGVVPGAVVPLEATPGELADALRAAGFSDVEAHLTGRFFMLASAVAA